MNINQKELIERLQKAKKDGVVRVLFITSYGVNCIKKLQDLELDNPKVKQSVFFKHIEGRVSEVYALTEKIA